MGIAGNATILDSAHMAAPMPLITLATMPTISGRRKLNVAAAASVAALAMSTAGAAAPGLRFRNRRVGKPSRSGSYSSLTVSGGHRSEPHKGATT
jgi:hypothetical protein